MDSNHDHPKDDMMQTEHQHHEQETTNGDNVDVTGNVSPVDAESAQDTTVAGDSTVSTVADLAALHDDDLVNINASSAQDVIVPMGAIRAGYTWPMPWEPLPTEDNKLVWLPGAVGFPPNSPTTFDNLYCVLHRFHDGTIIIYRMWGTNRLVTENGQPYLPNMPLNVAFMPSPDNGDMMRIHESVMTPPASVGVYLDTVEGIGERARRFYARHRKPDISLGSSVVRP